MAFFGQAGPEDAGGGSVGGISAPIVMDTSQIEPGLNVLRAGLDRAGMEITRLEAKMQGARRWTDTWMAGLGGLGAEAGRAGYKMQVFAQTFDDLQYVPQMGLRPILNNIIQISPALGIATIAVQGLVTALGGLEGINKKIFGDSTGLGTEAERMEKLAEKTKKSADETKVLNQHKKEQQQIEGMLGGQSAKDKATASAVQGVFDEVGAEKIVQGIMASRTDLEHDKHLPGAIARTQEQLDRARRVMAGGGTAEEITSYGGAGPAKEAERLQNQLNDLARRLLAARRLDAEREMAAAKKDPAELIRRFRENPELFPAGVLGRMEAADPRRVAGLAEEARNKGAAKELQDNLAKAEAANREVPYRQGQAMNEAEAARVAQGDQIEAKAREGVEAQKEENARREQLNAEQNRTFKGRVDEIARRKEMGSDLDWRLRLLLNPEKSVESMGIAEYGKSFKSTTGISEEARRLHAIEEILKERLLNQNKLKMIAVAKP